MGVFDFLLGKPASVESDPRTRAARDFILDELNRIYGQGPINVPTYFAEVPAARYSGTNNLLSALGLETVTPPEIATVDIGGINAYSSEPYQTQMEADFAEKYPSLYNELTNNQATNPAMTASLTPTFSDMTGGGSNSGGVGQERADFMAEHMARQKRNYAQGVSDGAMGFAQTPDKGIYAVGYNEGQISPREAAERGYTMKDKNPFDMSLGDHFSQIGSDVGTMASKVANDIKNTSLIGRIFGGR